MLAFKDLVDARHQVWPGLLNTDCQLVGKGNGAIAFRLNRRKSQFGARVLCVIPVERAPNDSCIDLSVRNVRDDLAPCFFKRLIPYDVRQHAATTERLGRRSVFVIEYLHSDLHLLEAWVIEPRDIKMPVSACHKHKAGAKIGIRGEQSMESDRHGDEHVTLALVHPLADEAAARTRPHERNILLEIGSNDVSKTVLEPPLGFVGIGKIVGVSADLQCPCDCGQRTENKNQTTEERTHTACLLW